NHILGKKALSTAYNLLAADVNHSKSITTADIVDIRKLILHLTNDFPQAESWEFLSTATKINNPANPWKEALYTSATVNNIQDDKKLDFIGYKMGDVDGNASPNVNGSSLEV